MAYGHLKISRKAYAEDPLWNERREFSRWEAWEDMIQMAAWKPHTRMYPQCSVELGRGEFPASYSFLATRWRWGIQRVRGFLKWLERHGRISTQQETQVGTVYLLVNYDHYQSTSEQGNTPTNTPATHRQHTGNKNKEAVKQLSIDNTLVQQVLDHYQETHPRRKVGDDKQKKLVTRVLKLGFSVDDLKHAITGNAKDPWHKEKRKHELGYVLRDADHINSFIDKYQEQQEPADLDQL